MGEIGLVKRGETFTGDIRLSRDLRVTTDGKLINVDRFLFLQIKRSQNDSALDSEETLTIQTGKMMMSQMIKSSVLN